MKKNLIAKSTSSYLVDTNIKYEEEYSKGSIIRKAKMTIWFSEDILSLGSDEEIFRDVKKIVRKKSMWIYERNNLRETTLRKRNAKYEKNT